jgi:Skp family chaperone for outer membrane proteins
MASVVERILEEKQRHEQLSATLKSLGGHVSEPVKPASKELEGKLSKIELSKTALELKQNMDRNELTIKQLQEQLHADGEQMKKVRKQMETFNRSGQPAWETTGAGTVPYRDPFHTGLSKRTPTGGYFTS